MSLKNKKYRSRGAPKTANDTMQRGVDFDDIYGDDDSFDERAEFLSPVNAGHLAEPSWVELLYNLCFDVTAFRLQCDRWNQLLIKEDLDRQYDKLSGYIEAEQRVLRPKEDEFERRFKAIRQVMNERLKDKPEFTRQDAEERLSIAEQVELNEIELLESDILRKKATMEILVTYLNNINKLRADSNAVLHDMAVMGMLDDVSRVTKSTRGLDIRQYSKQMCEQLHDITQQLGTLSKTQQRLMEVDLARKDSTLESKYARKSAIDLLFRKAVPAATTATTKPASANNNAIATTTMTVSQTAERRRAPAIEVSY